VAELGIGVIGLGRMGQVYGYHTARQVEGARLAAVTKLKQIRFHAFVLQPGPCSSEILRMAQQQSMS